MEQLIGHEWAKQLLVTNIAANRVPHAILVTGMPNIGKTTLCRFVGQALNCTGSGTRPCGECLNCHKTVSGNHPDIAILDEPGEPIKIEEVRTLQQQLSLTPYEGAWRIAILCDFERATREAANALLKTLEEPPPQVVMMLTATEPDILLPTIVSRCQVLSLRPLPVDQVKQALMQYWHASEAQADLLSHVSAGRLGWAISAMQDSVILERRETAIEDLLNLMSKNRVERLAYARALSRNPQLVTETLEYWLSWWHDLLTLRGGVGGYVINVDQVAGLQQRAELVTLQEVKNMVDQLRYTMRAIDQNANVRLALEVLLLSLPR